MTSAQPRSGAESDPALDDLVQRAQRGELPAFNAIVLRYQDHVFSLVLRMLTHREAAEDVTQEAFVSAWRHIDTFRGGSFRSWLFTIAANRARDELRKGVRPPPPAWMPRVTTRTARTSIRRSRGRARRAWPSRARCAQPSRWRSQRFPRTGGRSS